MFSFNSSCFIHDIKTKMLILIKMKSKNCFRLFPNQLVVFKHHKKTHFMCVFCGKL